LLQKITSSILYMPAEERTDRPVLGVVSGKQMSLIIDSGNSPAHARQFIKKLSTSRVPPPRLMGITHWHWDHTFGMSVWDIPTIAHVDTQKGLEVLREYSWDDESLDERVEQGLEIEFCAEMIKKEFAWDRDQIKIKLPEIIFPERLRIDLGGLTCLIERVGGDHEPGSTVFYIPEEKVLFLGDCLGPDLYAPKYYYSIDKFLGLLEKLRGYGAGTYVSSHGDPESREGLESEMKQWEEIARIVEKRGADYEGILSKLKESLGREPTQDDREMVEYLINGLEMKKNRT